RILDSWYLIAAACLDQQHADVSIFGQATRNYRTRRARSANDEVILSSQLGAEFLLIDANALNEFRIRRVVSETEAMLAYRCFFLHFFLPMISRAPLPSVRASACRHWRRHKSIVLHRDDEVVSLSRLLGRILSILYREWRPLWRSSRRAVQFR